VRGDKKPKRCCYNENISEYYFGKLEQIFGQLELGEKKSRPNYQIWISMKLQVPRTGLIKKLRKKFCSSFISVMTLSLDNSQMSEYCQKESRADLNDEYSHVQINNSFFEY